MDKIYAKQNHSLTEMDKEKRNLVTEVVKKANREHGENLGRDNTDIQNNQQKIQDYNKKIKEE